MLIRKKVAEVWGNLIETVKLKAIYRRTGFEIWL